MGYEGKRHLAVQVILGILLLTGSILPLIAIDPLPVGTLTYRETEGAETAVHVIAVQFREDGFQVELSTTRGAAVVRQVFLIAADLSTRAWTYSDPNRRMELAAEVRGDGIVLSGSWQGKRVDKRFDAGGPFWNQLFQMGLGPFVRSGKGGVTFRSIGTQGPGELKIGKMSVTRKEDETIEISGQKVAAVRLRISLGGLLSLFWHGDYWYRQSDGLFLHYRGRNRSGGPIAVSELIAEAPVDGS